jgi:hypothetical protein
MFLKSATGIAVSIPVLPSLISKNLRAQSTSPRKYFYFSFPNQGNSKENFVPNLTNSVAQTNLVNGRPYYSNNLVDILNQLQSEGVGQLARGIPLLTNETTLANKLNLLNGIDVVHAIGRPDHNGGSMLQGNGAAIKDGAIVRWGQTPTLIESAMPSIQTIDCIMQDLGILPGQNIWALGGRSLSNRFDPNRRQLVTGEEWVGLDPGYNTAGYLGAAPSTLGSNPNTIFLEFFSNLNNNGGGGPSPLVAGVDLVLNSYNSVLNGSQISAADSQSLEQHIDSINDLRASLQNSQSSGSCSVPLNNFINLSNNNIGESTPVNSVATYWDQLIQLASLGLQCNLTDKVTFFVDNSPATGDVRAHGGDPRRWHLEDAHMEIKDNIRAHVNFVNGMFLDLCRRLNVPEAGGNTYLDNSFGWIAPECSYGHAGANYTFLTAGNAQGAFHTGKFFNYEDSIAANPARHMGSTWGVGLPINRFWASVLQGHGATRAQYENSFGNQQRAAGSIGHGHYAQNQSGYESFHTEFDRSAHPEHFPAIALPLPGLLTGS